MNWDLFLYIAISPIVAAISVVLALLVVIIVITIVCLVVSLILICVCAILAILKLTKDALVNLFINCKARLKG